MGAPVRTHDHSVRPRGPQVGPRHAPVLDRVAAFAECLLLEGAVHDVWSEAFHERGRARGSGRHEGSGLAASLDTEGI